MWIYLGLLAAFFLGFHNLCKKYAVRENEVLPVLLGTVISGFVFICIFYVVALINPTYAAHHHLEFQNISGQKHGFIAIKSAIMASSWILAYEALKHLPITIVVPIRSAAPFFTFIGAIVIYQENPNLYQWIGFFVIIFSVFLYSQLGKKEGINFRNNLWIYAIIGATFLGSVSGLYDKYLVQSLELNPQTLQFWFCFYTILILIVIMMFRWFPDPIKREAFQFRWSILGVGVLLQSADYFYFKALQDPQALVMILSAIKRSQLVIAVVVGGWLFKEQNKTKKLVPLIGVIVGVCLILWS